MNKADQMQRTMNFALRAACRGKSVQDFLAKMKICEEESDESVFWLEMIEASGLLPSKKMGNIIDEAHQLSAIITAACKTTAAKLRKP